ncbi:TPA: zinc ribbon domain-containing protein [Shewanella algae]|nr:zinc ribbon domain-containing protein [Shewanella algae]
MALVKCKECGEEVSTKAKTCPKCGAKAPKKTSLFTWFVLGFIIFVVYTASQSPSTPSKAKPSSTTVSTPQKSESTKKVVPPKPSWVTSTSKDEMTGKFSAYAHSPTAFPSKKMDFPYHDVNSWMGVGCDAKSEWVYFGFNGSPNLANDQTEDGYNLIHTRIRWNETVESVPLTQDWGAKFIHFRNDAAAVSKITASKTALLELQWHGQQPTYFEYSLNGSSKAISEIRAMCAANK